MSLTPKEIVNAAVGPYDKYCDGYGNPGSSGVGYISVLTLDTGKVKLDMDNLLEEIAVPKNKKAADILNMTVDEWEEEVKL
ncbi:histidine decarboxylase, pyruvoyl type [Patescibacteria group bacterium]|nr:histidine decarboxylase, pyruvoyl type [Patescibacteria group bacterium]